MSDPTVIAYLTKLLCSHGGRVEREQLGNLLDLPVEQIEQILQDEPLRFPLISQQVLAQSPLRICSRYLYPKKSEGDGKEDEEEKCPNLHLCRYYLRGQCHPHRRPPCKFSHDVLSDHNRAVLKANLLTGLHEDEIKVLLFQNDNQLLPEDCTKYIQGNCEKGENCPRLHMCRHFTRGDCNRSICKKSHNLLESTIMLSCSWMSQKTKENFQMLCMLKHNKRLKEIQEDANHEGGKGAQRQARGRGRGRGRGRPGFQRERDSSQDALEGRNRETEFDCNGLRFPFRSLSQPASQCSVGHNSGAEGYIDSSNDNEKLVNNNVISPVPKPVIEYGKPLSPSASGPPKVATTSTNTPLTSPMGPSLKAETRESSFEAVQKLMTEFDKMASSGSTSWKISQTSSATSKTSLRTGDISYTPQPKQMSGSSGQLNHPVMGVSRVPAAPSVTLITSPIKASYTVETSIATDIASPRPLPASKIIDNSSSKSSCIPNQKLITDSGKVESSPLTRPANVFPTSTSTLKASPYFNGEELYTVPLNPASSTVTSPSHPPSSSSSYFRSDIPPKKLCASVEPMKKSDVPNANQFIVTRDESKAQKPMNTTAPQLQPATSVPSAALKKASPDKTPEICLHYIWKYCRLGDRCVNMHYYLPYRWQEFNGIDWVDLPDMEQIEKTYSDPNIIGYQSINLQAMKLGTKRVRRLATPSSVTRPSEYVLTTEWIWYWKDEYGTWTKYGELNTKKVGSSICSSDLENVYLSDPSGTVNFSAGNQTYIINFQEMRQRNVHYQTEKQVCRRPKFLDFEAVKMLKGSTKSAAESLTQTSSNPLLKTLTYPDHWCTKSMPEIGYKKILVLENSKEFSNVVTMFSKTVTGHTVQKLWRVQNPSLWQVYQWQKDHMKKKNPRSDVDERQLFHGTNMVNIDAICRDNFDWRICGTNGTVYGQGSYFARDASYSHNYSIPTRAGERTMFVARVLVGDFAVGDSSMRLPPKKYNKTENYDSCVDDIRVPSIFVVFDKLQIYPEYILEYGEEKKSSCVIS